VASSGNKGEGGEASSGVLLGNRLRKMTFSVNQARNVGKGKRSERLFLACVKGEKRDAQVFRGHEGQRREE